MSDAANLKLLHRDRDDSKNDMPSTRALRSNKEAAEKYGETYKKALEQAEEAVAAAKQAQVSQSSSVGVCTPDGIATVKKEPVPPEEQKEVVKRKREERQDLVGKDKQDDIRKAEKARKYVEYAEAAQQEAVKYKLKKRKLKEDLALREQKVNEELNVLARLSNMSADATCTTHDLRKFKKLQEQLEAQKNAQMYNALLMKHSALGNAHYF